MSSLLRVGILGLGPAGVAHGRGYLHAGGYRIDSVCDLIGTRSESFRRDVTQCRVSESLDTLLKDPGIDVVSVCLPTDLHAPVAVKALRAGKHVVLEVPLADTLKGARALLRAAERAAAQPPAASKVPPVLLPAYVRLFGGPEMASQQAVGKGYIGEPRLVRATWFRPLGVPQGARARTDANGWYVDRNRSGGGALIDLGGPLLALGWSLLGRPMPLAVFAHGGSPLTGLPVEEHASLLIRFEGGAALELSVAWAAHLPPRQYGVACRVSGDAGCIDVYAPEGAVLYRGQPGHARATVLKGPKLTHHAAMMRHLKTLIGDDHAAALRPLRQAVTVAAMLDAAYRSLATGRSADVREPGGAGPEPDPAASARSDSARSDSA